ncbi:MAG TPA: DUF4062 domain-containing protein [bacterium]|nr:DUF4062 domain-containing protein [bacterium]
MSEETHPLPQFGKRQLKVFISGVVGEFRSERIALADLIRCNLKMAPLHCEDPAFAEEDEKPQHACLRGVDEADICLFLFGISDGFLGTKSGLSPTEEEFRTAFEAKKRNIYCVKDTSAQRQPGMQRIIDEVGGYEDGKWCQYFKDETDLLQRASGRLREMKDTWDFSNEIVDTFFVIRMAVQYYAQRDLSPELLSKGRRILLGITGLDELPPILALAANRLEWRHEPDYSLADENRLLGPIDEEVYNAHKGYADDDNRKENFTISIRNVRRLIEISTKERVRNADVNGGLMGWLKECMGVPRRLSWHFGIMDRKPARLPDWQSILYDEPGDHQCKD